MVLIFTVWGKQHTQFCDTPKKEYSLSSGKLKFWHKLWNHWSLDSKCSHNSGSDNLSINYGTKRKMAERMTLRSLMGREWTKGKKRGNPIEEGKERSKI